MREANKHIELPMTHTPNIDDLLSDLGHRKCRFYSTIDLSKAFHQIPLSENAKKIATFVTPFGCYSFNRAPYGVKNISIVFTALMNKVLKDALNSYCFAWIDDICVYSETYGDHLKHLADILERLRQANLTIEPRKTRIARKSIKFIGFILDNDGIRPDPSNIEKVKQFQRPHNIKSTRAYLGLTGFLRRFIYEYSQIARPLQLLTHKSKKFIWNDEAEKSIRTLQDKITNAPTLGYVDLMSKEPLILTTDASNNALGYCLRQNQLTSKNTLEQRYLLYGGRSLTDQQKIWPIWELEQLSIVNAFNKLDQFLRCKPFILVCDSTCVTHLLSKDIATTKPRIARWIMSLRNYQYQIVHKPGNSEYLAMADYISRQPDDNYDEEIDVKVEPFIQNITTNDKYAITDSNFKIMKKDDVKVCIDEIKTAQLQHHLYNPMINYLSTEELPTTKKLAKQIQSQDFIIMNDLLYHIWYDKLKHRTVDQLCITEKHIGNILQGCHDSVFSGHNGQLNTLLRIRENYYWQGMSKDCTKYVESCEICAMANRSYTAPIPLQNKPIPDGPLQSISIDLLSIATPSNKYRHIFVAVCDFSKILIAKPMMNKTGKSTAKMIFQNIILTYGIPTQLNIISDSGPDMVSTIVQTLYDSFNIKNIRITSYNSKANGGVERQNSTILAILRRFCMNDPKSWSQYLNYAVLSINSMKSSSSGYTPFELLHGISMKSPLDIQLPKPRRYTNTDQEKAYQHWYKNITNMRDIAKDILNYSKQVQKKMYDRKCKPHNLKIGDTVYVSRPAIGIGIDPKLSSKFPTKYIIIKFIGTTNVILEDNNGNQMERSMHINRLKKVPERTSKDPDFTNDKHMQNNKHLPNKKEILKLSKHDHTRNLKPFIPKLYGDQNYNNENDICIENSPNNDANL